MLVRHSRARFHPRGTDDGRDPHFFDASAESLRYTHTYTTRRARQGDIHKGWQGRSGGSVRKPTILIVDDDPITHGTLRGILGEDAYQLLSGYSASEASPIIESHDIDLIILDVVMPGTSGLELCRELRASALHRDMPILIFTSLQDQAIMLEGFSAGADDFLTKPIDPLELQVRIRTMMRLNRYRRLMDERSRLEWVIEQSSHGYLVLDPLGKLLHANPTARAMLGIRQGDVEGVDFLEAARANHLLTPPEAWADWETVCGTDQVPLHLLRPETERSRCAWLQLSLQTKAGDEPGIRLAKLSDVTEELEERRARWTFQSMVNHKFRTPMNAIGICAQMMQLLPPEEWAENLPPISEAFIEEVQRLDDQIRSILAYTEAPRLLPADASLSGAEIASIVREVAAELGLSSMLTITGLDSVQDRRVRFSAPAMTAAMIQVLGNAKKFHPEGNPRLLCALEETEVGGICINLFNDGAPIPPDQLTKAFIPYFQGEKYHTGQVPGMGLGLPMVAQLVWQAGGACAIRNASDNSGVTLELAFPPRQEAHP